MKADFWIEPTKEWFFTEQLINMRLTCDCTLTCLSDRHCVPSAIKMMMIYSFSYRLIRANKRDDGMRSKELFVQKYHMEMFRNRSEEWRVSLLTKYHSSIINNNVNCKHHCECSSVLSISGCHHIRAEIWKWVPTTIRYTQQCHGLLIP